MKKLSLMVVMMAWGLISFQAVADVAVKLDGEPRKWHKLSLTFDGPEASEDDEFNPFLNYRLNVRFTHVASGREFLVPGYFAADGNAAETSATSGNKWRVHFAADALGEWRWQASFRKNRWVAVSALAKPGVSGAYMDGQQGRFKIKNNNKKLPDFRAAGRLEYINQPYLRFAETQNYFIKAGPDAPENLLAYADFDGTFHSDGHKDNLVKTWQPHVQDWRKGDPSWQKGKGKGLIGALNYIAGKGMNSVSFLTNNIVGDDRNVFPYVDYDHYDRMDVSKLDQWEIIFTHAQKLGLFLHFKTQEVENQGLLDGGGLGVQRKLYYRELIARFGHHLALNWNMGEENGEWVPNHTTAPQDTAARLAMARYFYENDPYNHHLVIHNGVDYDDLLGSDSFYTGASLQTHNHKFVTVHPLVKRLREWPVVNGRPLAVAVDEPGDAEHALLPDSEDPSHDVPRMYALWGALTAGAWGTEWYFGYAHAHSDLTAEDWRSRDLFWDQARHALDFFNLIKVPYQQAVSHDKLSTNSYNNWILAKPAEFYIVHVKDASKELKLKVVQDIADYTVQWFDPRNGGGFQKGSVSQFSITKQGKHDWQTDIVDLGQPPNSPAKDWVVFVKRK